MSLPARKLPGATRRRKKQAYLRRIKRRLLGIPHPLPRGGQWTAIADVADISPPTSIRKDIERMIEALEKDKRDDP